MVGVESESGCGEPERVGGERDRVGMESESGRALRARVGGHGE